MTITTTSLKTTLLLACAALALAGDHAFAQATGSTYTGPDNSNWNDPMHWTPVGVPNNNGAATFDVTIDNLTVNLDIDPTISSLTMLGDAPYLFSTDHSLKVGATDEVEFGDIEFTAQQKDVKCDLGDFKAFANKRLDETAWFIAVSAAAGRTATLQFNGADVVSNNGAPGFMGPGTALITDENGLDAFRNMVRNEPLGFFEVGPGLGSHYTVAKSVTNEGVFMIFDGGTLAFAQNLTQVGDLRDPNDQHGGFIEEHSENAPTHVVINGVLTNYDPSTKTLHNGRHNLDGGDSGIATLQVLGGAIFEIVNNDASILLKGPGGAILDKNGANALRNLAINNRFRFENHDFTTTGSLASNSAPTALLSARKNSHLTVSGNLSILAGSMEISPLGLDNAVAPASSEVIVNGAFSLAEAAKLHFEVFGPGVTGTVTVTGNADLHGALEIFVLPNAPIKSSGSLTLMTAKKITGAFSNVASGGRATAYAISNFNGPLGTYNGVITGSFKTTYDNDSLVISDFQPHSSLLNISTRLNVQTNDNAVFAGFIVRGIGPKKVIVRGVGPSLTAKGVPGALADPILELHDSTGAIVQTSDNWQEDSTKAADITATGIAPNDPKESAIVASLNPGTYTAALRGANNTSGLGLVEVYDLDRGRAPSEFANISTRGRVGIGDSVMIGGVIIGAPDPAHLIVRAIGPSLASNNISGALQDPTLELRDASGTLLNSNDNWQDDSNQAAQVQSAMLAPLDPRESALAVSLTPGNYTAIVRGKNNTQGVALVEFYKLN